MISRYPQEMSDTSSERKKAQHVSVCHSFRPARKLLHSEVGRLQDLVGCLEWHLRFAAMIVLEWQTESCAAGDGLVKT